VSTESESSRSITPLQQRLVTAGVLAPLSIVAILLLPTPYFAMLIAGVICVGAFEWAGLVGVGRRRWRWFYVGLIGACMLLLWYVLPSVWDTPLLAVAACWWVVTAFTLSRIRNVQPSDGLTLTLVPIGLIVLLPPWIAIVRLHAAADNGPWLVLALMMLIWIADSAAYFSGRRWGSRRLAPALSPGKTLAGVYGALIGASVWGLVLVALFHLSVGRGLLLVLLCALTVALSIVGDLYESLLKRRRGLKDTGSILPGHGGVLDRIDSMTAAAPFFTLGLLWLGRGL
jgi:phosphatidate cytidylyltransferase